MITHYSHKVPLEKIAKAYSFAKDEFQNISEADLHNMRKLIQMQFAYLSKRVYFDFVDEDPYPYVKINEFDNDWRKGVIKVNTSGNESRLWGKVYNLQFRAIHDYIHCVHRLDFDYMSEVKAFRYQYEFSMMDMFTKEFPYMNWELYHDILCSEIIYQAAVKEHYEQFHIDQKIILSNLFNNKL